MYLRFFCTGLFIAAMFTSTAKAEQLEKRFSVGLTSYATSINFDATTDTASGIGLTAKAALGSLGKGRLAVMTNLVSMKHIDFSGFTVDNVDMSLIWGSNLTRSGFFNYLGAGLFTEKWASNRGFEEEYSGGQLTGGIGYNFETFNIEFYLNLRNAAAYEVAGIEPEAAVAGGLAFSFRF